jgi:hypothetical protein
MRRGRGQNSSETFWTILHGSFLDVISNSMSIWGLRSGGSKRRRPGANQFRVLQDHRGACRGNQSLHVRPTKDLEGRTRNCANQSPLCLPSTRSPLLDDVDRIAALTPPHKTSEKNDAGTHDPPDGSRVKTSEVHLFRDTETVCSRIHFDSIAQIRECRSATTETGRRSPVALR